MSSPNRARTGYAPVQDLQLYYELHGPADSSLTPLVLLHGGGDTIETSFGAVLEPLARTRPVIAFEQQGYGRTADLADQPFDFARSADHTAGLLAHLGIASADVLGFSNGGTIALEVAIRHPRIVRKLVAVSAFFSREGGEPWFWQAMQQARLENMPQELQEAYRRVAPRPDDLRTMHDKAAQRMRDFRDIARSALGGITAPTLVLTADRDVVRPEHAVDLFRLIPGAQLAVIPGTNHMTLLRETDVVVPLLNRFLAQPLPART